MDMKIAILRRLTFEMDTRVERQDQNLFEQNLVKICRKDR